jgi:hypothetical protein
MHNSEISVPWGLQQKSLDFKVSSSLLPCPLLLILLESVNVNLQGASLIYVKKHPTVPLAGRHEVSFFFLS